MFSIFLIINYFSFSTFIGYACTNISSQLYIKKLKPSTIGMLGHLYPYCPVIQAVQRNIGDTRQSASTSCLLSNRNTGPSIIERKTTTPYSAPAVISRRTLAPVAGPAGSRTTHRFPSQSQFSGKLHVTPLCRVLQLATINRAPVHFVASQPHLNDKWRAANLPIEQLACHEGTGRACFLRSLIFVVVR